MKLVIDGKPYEHPMSSRVRKAMKICDEMEYGQAISTAEIVKRMGLIAGSHPLPSQTTDEERAELDKRRFRVSHALMVWGHPNTIRDLNNGTIEF